jgi:2-haloacid dehalogenase
MGHRDRIVRSVEPAALLSCHLQKVIRRTTEPHLIARAGQGISGKVHRELRSPIVLPVNRRRFVNLTAASAAASFATAVGVAEATPQVKAIAFDGLVVFDLRPIAALTEELFPGRGAELSSAWRTRQFEYTWLRTLSGDYANFWQVTGDALTFAAKLLDLDLTREKRDRLMEAFLRLKAWPDVLPTLTALKEAGVRMALLSDFSAEMLDTNVGSAGLEGLFGDHLSTDRVRAFKPDPRTYRMGIESFKLKREEIVFAAFGGWDAAGAKRFGYPTFWCNRLKLPIEELGTVPDSIGSTTVELATFVQTL